MSTIDTIYIFNLLFVTPFAFANLSLYNTPVKAKKNRTKVMLCKTVITLEFLFTFIWIYLKTKGVI